MLRQGKCESVVLSGQTLSYDFAGQIQLGNPSDTRWLTLGELRRQKPFQLLRTLRGLSAQEVLVAVESTSDQAMVPAMQLLAFLIPAKSRLLIGHDLTTQTMSRKQVIADSVGTIIASLRAWFSVLLTNSRLTKVLKENRRTPLTQPLENGLYLHTTLWFGLKAGGSVGHVAGVLNGFSRRGLKIRLATNVEPVGIDAGVQVAQLPLPTRFGFPWENNYYYLNSVHIRYLRSLLGDQPTDFIYQRLSVGSYAGAAIAQELGIPFVLEYNGSETWIAKNWGTPLRHQLLAERIEQANLDLADLVVTVSDELRLEVLRRGIPANRIVTYPNCVDPQLFSPDLETAHETTRLRTHFGIPQDAVVVGFVGTFGAWHGAEILAQAITILLAEEGDLIRTNNVYFLLVGNGLRMPAVLSTLGTWKDSPRVILTGLVPQSQTPSLLSLCDVLVSPHVPNADGSPFFGSPTKLYEYMAMGKAIVASDLDQIGDVLRLTPTCREGRVLSSPLNVQGSGLLVEPGNASQLANALTRLILNPDLRGQLGENARELVLERFTWQHHVEAILRGLNGTMES